MPTLSRLHIITNCHYQNRFSHKDLAVIAASSGADAIQFRDKSFNKKQAFRAASDLVDVCKGTEVMSIINDHVDIALDLGADGVHLGVDDLPVPVARRILGADKIIGATASSVEKALELEKEGANYLGVGPVFSGDSKAPGLDKLGLQVFEDICRFVTIPVIGIGGIKRSNASQVIDAGAHGIAVMTEVCCADNPAGVVAEFASLFK